MWTLVCFNATLLKQMIPKCWLSFLIPTISIQCIWEHAKERKRKRKQNILEYCVVVTIQSEISACTLCTICSHTHTVLCTYRTCTDQPYVIGNRTPGGMFITYSWFAHRPQSEGELLKRIELLLITRVYVLQWLVNHIRSLASFGSTFHL